MSVIGHCPHQLIVFCPQPIRLDGLSDSLPKCSSLQNNASMFLQECNHTSEFPSKGIDATLPFRVGRIGAEGRHVLPPAVASQSLMKHTGAIAGTKQADKGGRRRNVSGICSESPV